MDWKMEETQFDGIPSCLIYEHWTFLYVYQEYKYYAMNRCSTEDLYQRVVTECSNIPSNTFEIDLKTISTIVWK